jgi:hypothetical protein
MHSNNCIRIGSKTMRFLLIALLLITGSTQAIAQSPFYYTFSNSTSPFALLTGATAVTATNSSNDDGISAVQNIGFTFNFNGTAFTQFKMNTNGWIGLGSAATATTNYSSLNGAESNVIAAYSGDLTSTGGAMSFLTSGTPGSQICKIEWKSTTEFTASEVPAASNFQIWLYEGTDVIEIHYDAFTAGTRTAAQSPAPQVGLRGTASTPEQIVALTTISNWAAPVVTNTSTSAMIATTTVLPDAGRTYTFTPPASCSGAPTSLAASINTTPGVITIAGSFTAAPPTAPSAYMVVRTSTNTQPVPVDGTIYSVGNNAIGFIEYVGTTAGSWTSTGLSPNTTYYYWVFSICATGTIYSTSATTVSAATGGCALSGTKSVGPGGDYATLKDAVDAITTNGVTASVILELNAAYTSSTDAVFPIVLGTIPCADATKTVTIRPAAGAGAKTVSGANAVATLDINGGNYWIIDGRQGGTGTSKDLTIGNTNTSGTAIRLINEASNNSISYTTLQGVNTSTTSGVVVFSTTTGANGNDNNTIQNCDIRDGATTPLNGIFSSGTTTAAAQNNSGNSILNNNIYNYFGAAADHNGISVAGGNTDWTVSGNSFYQTASRAMTSSLTASAIRIINTTGNNFTVSGNFIGGTAPSCGGTAMTYTGTTTAGVIFRGMIISVGNTAVSNVQGNTAQNVSISTGSTSTAQSMFSLLGGRLDVGTTTANTIGNQTGTNSIVFINANTSTSLIFSAMLLGTGTGDVTNVQNNTIGGIAVSTSSTGSVSVRGIGFQGSTGTYTVTGNTIGSATTANSITNATNNSLIAIFGGASNTTVTQTISNNLVANVACTSTGTSGSVMGILAQGNTGGIYNTTGNTVRNINSTAANTGSGSAASIVGINHIASTTAGQSVSQNTVHTLSNTSAAASSITMAGIFYSGPTSGNNSVSKNFIHGLSLAATGAAPIIHGINVGGGLTTIHNNMISLGASVTANVAINGINDGVGTNNYYYNSVNIRGSANNALNCFAFVSSVTTNTRSFQNNIFTNERTNSGTGRSYAVQVAGTAANPAGLTINYNDYYVNGTGTVFGRFNAADVTTLAAWRTAVGQDVNSLNVNPNFIAPAAATPDLHITSGSSELESAANSIGSITTDIDNQTRPGAPSGSNNGFAHDIGADEFDGLNPNLCTGTPASAGTASASNTTVCNTGTNVTLTLTGATAGPGIQYQWQSSPAGAGTFTDISGATSTSYTLPVNASTDFRCIVRCGPSAQQVISNIITVTAIVCEFSVTRTTGITFNSISATGTSMSGWRNGNSTDDNLSTAQPIGFSFFYKGANYTQFSVSTNGYLTFNVGTSATGSGTGAYGYDNTQFSSQTGTLNALAPFYDDLVCQGNPATAAGLASAMKYELSGTAPNRILTVEWIGLETFGNAGPNLNFQVKLYETSGQIEYVYGTVEGFNGTADYGYAYSMGLNGPSLRATPVLSELQTQQVENVQNFASTPANALGRAPECNVRYTFVAGAYNGAAPTPGAPANDDISTPVGLAVNSAPCTALCGTYYTTRLATASAGITACGATGTPDDDVWFTFTATTTQQNITVRSGGGFNAVVQLFSDAGITSINCVNATGNGLTETINATGLTPGNVYYIRVFHSGTGSNNATTATGTSGVGVPDFSICVNEIVPPPANDNPCGAVPLTVSGVCTPYSDNSLPSQTSFVTATNTTSNGVVTPTCTGAGTVNDVWFSFVAPASGTVNTAITPVSGVNPAVQLFSVTSGTCAGNDLVLASVNCVNANSTGIAETPVFSGLTAGNTYYVRVYQHPSGIGGSPVSNSQFSICIFAPLPTCPTNFAPANGGTSCSGGTLLSWTAGANTNGYDVYFNAGAGPATTLVSPNQAGTTYSTGPLTPGVYSWRVEARNGNGVSICSNLSFTVVAGPGSSVSPAGPISICAPATQTLTGTTSSTNQRYQWREGNTNISGATSATYVASTSGSYRLIVTDTITGCSDTSNTVLVTVSGAPTVTITPSAPTISCDSVRLNGFAGDQGLIKINEVTLFRTGIGQTPTYPGYIGSGDADFIEISNISSSPIDVSGYTLADYTDNSATAVHNLTIPASTIIPANSVMVIHLGTGTDVPASLYFNTGGATDNWSSGSVVGFVLKNSGGAVVDVVGCGAGGSYTFAAGTGVTAADWTGAANNLGGQAGIIRNASLDNNNGSDWVISNTPTPLQSIGTYNVGYAVPSYSWSPSTGLFIDAALTTPYTGQNTFIVYAKPASTTTYTLQVNVGSCSNSNTVTVTVLPPGTLEWTGAVNTDWTNAGNWKCGIVPTITSNVVINSGCPNYPVLTLNVEIRSMTVRPGASVTVNTGFDLKLNGN